MNYLLPILVFYVLMGAFYLLIGRKTSLGEGVGLVLAVAAAFPLLSGGLLLYREYGRSEEGRVSAGVVTGKLSSTGENGSRTIGGGQFSRARGRRRLPTVMTSNGFGFDDVLARVMRSGSPDAWFVEYRYPCDTFTGCWQREAVSHDMWSDLEVGQMVNVRTAKDQNDRGRLDANPQWGTALAKVAIGGTLGLLAGLVSGRLAPRRRRLVTVPAVVTSVEPMTAGRKVHWRVKYAYLTPDGAAFENADEVYVSGLRPGDNCLAVYPPDQPDAGTLRLTDRAAG